MNSLLKVSEWFFRNRLKADRCEVFFNNLLLPSKKYLILKTPSLRPYSDHLNHEKTIEAA
jgi:hypothetical protein